MGPNRLHFPWAFRCCQCFGPHSSCKRWQMSPWERKGTFQCAVGLRAHFYCTYFTSGVMWISPQIVMWSSSSCQVSYLHWAWSFPWEDLCQLRAKTRGQCVVPEWVRRGRDACEQVLPSQWYSFRGGARLKLNSEKMYFIYPKQQQ